LHFKSYIVFQFLTKLLANWPIYSRFVAFCAWRMFILNPFTQLQEAAVFTWGCKGHAGLLYVSTWADWRRPRLIRTKFLPSHHWMRS